MIQVCIKRQTDTDNMIQLCIKSVLPEDSTVVSENSSVVPEDSSLVSEYQRNKQVEKESILPDKIVNFAHIKIIHCRII